MRDTCGYAVVAPIVVIVQRRVPIHNDKALIKHHRKELDVCRAVCNVRKARVTNGGAAVTLAPARYPMRSVALPNRRRIPYMPEDKRKTKYINVRVRAELVV